MLPLSLVDGCPRVESIASAFKKQMNIDTLISAISDLQNQAVTAPQRVGFFEGRGGKPSQGIVPAKHAAPP